MLDMSPYADHKSSWVPFGAGEIDYAVHLPQRSTMEQSLLRSMAIDYTYRSPTRSTESILNMLKDMPKPTFKKNTK